MAVQEFTYPSSASPTLNINSEGVNGQPAPLDSLQVGGKDNNGDLQPLSVTSAGILNVNVASSLVPVTYDEIDLTYIVAGNGTGQVGTAVYKLAGTTVKTLTLSYDASNRLSTVVAS